MIFRVILIAFLFSKNAIGAPDIVVSINPLHSIVSALTKGITTPKLLLKTGQSAHHFHLHPAQLSLLEKADLIVLVHPDFEHGIAKVLNHIKPNKQLRLNQKSQNNHHSWLDINHIQHFAAALRDKLKHIDMENKTIYQQNFKLLNQRLEQLKSTVKKKLSIYSEVQVIPFSNAFAYFLKANNLTHTPPITQSHAQRLNIKAILNGKRTIKNTQAKCLLSSSQIPQKQIRVIIESSNINTVSIDIIGAGIPPGPQHYFQLIQNITHRLIQCL